jgi:hypothetical protein
VSALSAAALDPAASRGLRAQHLGFKENPMLCHDSLRLRARAFMYVRVCLLAMIFAVALVAPSAVAQTTAPQYLFLSTSVPN